MHAHKIKIKWRHTVDVKHGWVIEVSASVKVIKKTKTENVEMAYLMEITIYWSKTVEMIFVMCQKVEVF